GFAGHQLTASAAVSILKISHGIDVYRALRAPAVSRHGGALGSVVCRIDCADPRAASRQTLDLPPPWSAAFSPASCVAPRRRIPLRHLHRFLRAKRYGRGPLRAETSVQEAESA